MGLAPVRPLAPPIHSPASIPQDPQCPPVSIDDPAPETCPSSRK
jgi:hypothetical protein